VSQASQKTSDTVQAQVEALTAVAKKLNGDGNEAQALEAYKTASELMLGAPWLQHRTAELARKLRQPEVASLHYRRAAAAFIRAGFPKRALAPLRTARQVSASLLPNDPSSFITATLELANVQRGLGCAADALLVLASANQALRAAGCTERVPYDAELTRNSSRPPPSGVTSSVPVPFARDLTRLDDAVKP
jgi:hypothetical protein